MRSQPNRRRKDFVGAGCRARPGDDRMVAEKERGILDEHRIRVISQIWQANDVVTGVLERLLVGCMLGSGEIRIDLLAIEMG